MSRPGDESKVGSLSHRRHSKRLRQRTQRLRQLIVKSGPPSRSLLANVRDTAASSTANGGPGGNRRSSLTAPVPPDRSASPAFICRCPVDVETAGEDEEEAEDPAPVDREHVQCCVAVESLRPQLAAILAEVRCVTNKMTSDDWNDEQTSDWKFAAMVIDRLSFWTLTVYLVIVTVAVFGSVLRNW